MYKKIIRYLIYKNDKYSEDVELVAVTDHRHCDFLSTLRSPFRNLLHLTAAGRLDRL